MKGATMKVTMEKLGITASCSRPRASHDNPFSEALRIPTHPVGRSDNIRSAIPEYPVT